MGIDDAFGMKFLGTLFAISNPISGLPVFLALTASLARLLHGLIEALLQFRYTNSR